MKTIDRVFDFIYNFQETHYLPGDVFNDETASHLGKEFINNFIMYKKFFKEKGIAGLCIQTIYVKEGSGEFYPSTKEKIYFWTDLDGKSSYSTAINLILYTEDNYIITSNKNEEYWIFQFFKFESETDKNKFIIGVTI